VLPPAGPLRFTNAEVIQINRLRGKTLRIATQFAGHAAAVASQRTSHANDMAQVLHYPLRA
jgi:hypothetical protein